MLAHPKHEVEGAAAVEGAADVEAAAAVEGAAAFFLKLSHRLTVRPADGSA